MNISNTLTSNPLSIANTFNSYFTTVAENLTTKHFSGNSPTNNNDPLSLLGQNFNQSFPDIRLKNTTTHEISKIIYFLKCKDFHGYDEVSTGILTLCRSNLNPYCLGRKAAFFSVGI
jgi:hypothetical protein